MKRNLFITIVLLALVKGVFAQMADNSVFSYTPELKRLADQGDAKSMFRMGYIYYHGPNSPLCPSARIATNADKAMFYLKGAAEKGEPDAQYWYGNIFFYGIPGAMNPDYKKAVYWFQKASEGGNIDALINLGNAYQVGGNGIVPNEDKALEAYQKAANKGNAVAQYNLSVVYHWGQLGVKADGAECVKWVKLAAEQDYLNALEDLGVYYMQGYFVDLDPNMGVKMFRRAASKGSARAWYLLGECYRTGEGLDVNLKNAAVCYYRSLDKGYDRKTVLEGLEQCYQKGVFKANDFTTLSLWVKHVGELIERYDAKKAIEDKNLASDNVKGADNVQKAVDVVDINIPKTNSSKPNTFAIIIGNEHYQSVASVPFANNDAVVFAKYCENTLGIPHTNIRQYNDLTYAGMLTAFDDLKNIAEAFGRDINIIVYYAGHGIPDEKSKSSYLLPIDSNGKNLNVCCKLSDLYNQLNEFKAKSVMVFLDACFSGSQRGEGMLSSARGVMIKAKPATPKGNMTVFCAASGDETAYPYKEKGHGLFTYFLLRKLQETKGKVGLDELAEYVKENVQKQSVLVNRKPQTPQLMMSGEQNKGKSMLLDD